MHNCSPGTTSTLKFYHQQSFILLTVVLCVQLQMHPFPSFIYKEAKNIDSKRPNRQYVKPPGASNVVVVLP